MKRGEKKIVLYLILGAGLFVGIVGGIVLGLWLKELPRVESLANYKPDVVTRIYAEDNQIIGEFYTERRIPLKRQEIPEAAIMAILAAEDAEFYSHSGFDLPGIMRAAIKNLKNLRNSQGASTITQQLARMLFLTNKKSYVRKIKEAILTIKIERYYSKDEIITLYLNLSYFGHGAYGIQSASLLFFNRPISELSLDQCTMLMGLLKNPASFSPLNHPDRALKSRDRILERMLYKKMIDVDQLTLLKARDLGLESQTEHGNLAPYFVEEVRKNLTASLGNERVLTGGLKVNTTLNPLHQQAANNAVESGLNAFRERHGDDVEIQVALIAIRPKTGEITAMIGGADFKVTQFNRAVQAERQSGSAIKPFVYLTAFINGIKPSDIVIDEKIEYVDPASKVIWKPRNYDRKFHGPVTLRYALEHSLNAATVKVLQKVGIDALLDTIRRAGVESELPPYLSVGLGSGEVTLMELTNAYATIAAEGIRVKPRLIRDIESIDGVLIESFPVDVEEVFSAEHCYQLTRVMQGVVQSGTCWRARRLNRPIAAKTGTTNDSTDAWFVGYTPSLAVGVWVGYDLKRTMGSGETGSRAAGPIFVDFFEQILNGTATENFIKPVDIENIMICAETGFLVTDQCPERTLEAFIKGSAPREPCPIHR